MNKFKVYYDDQPHDAISPIIRILGNFTKISCGELDGGDGYMEYVVDGESIIVNHDDQPDDIVFSMSRVLGKYGLTINEVDNGDGFVEYEIDYSPESIEDVE